MSSKVKVYESAAAMVSVLMTLVLVGFVMLPAVDPGDIQVAGVAFRATQIEKVPTPAAPGSPSAYNVKTP
jgi:hypothetical protein